MDIKLYKVVSSYPIISDLFTQKLNGALAFKVLSTLKELEAHMENFNELKDKLLKDNGIEKGTTIEDIKLLEKLNKELSEITDVDVKIHSRKFTLEELERVEISAQNLVLIDWLIDYGDNS